MTNNPDETTRPDHPTPPTWGDPFHYGLPGPHGADDAAHPAPGPREPDFVPAPQDAELISAELMNTTLVDAVLRAVGDQRGGPPTLWFLVLDSDDRPMPVVLPVEHATVAPSETVGALLVHVLLSVVRHEAPAGSVLIGYTREGGGAEGAFERGWSGVLRGLAARAGLRIRAEVAVGPHRAGVIRG
ncbi:hypothetical protein QUV83_03705 [Cellulomonas cellasea]|uniref:hypothetical protein n=1 Tax=Cellulomonas cellasea TaxID=43670 RepID=UPI0025A48773|nr:hypothetical protein [Cellulomonas cellasea]MDM8083871.1 hypothetical protein [Cellulomonas cellasea]